ncbi:tetratricopeptide repeat-containing sensor histidine kinase [Nonlabens agnitus]|uniref:histidine kinase n=1 Tax=Nonlabens agnitus TaxID=870484 RepID=A0A2S9WQB2_9FLAO|nr:tetratricopeptide repeat protein [Nonlabens agnitus]PRP65665.1 hypothetical protein BST86_00450 [Nonlabens agnitus]
MKQLALTVFLFFSILANAQTEKNKNNVELSKDELKFKAKIELADKYLFTNIDSATYFIKQAEEISNRIADEILIRSFLKSKGDIYKTKNDFEEALVIYEELLDSFQEKGDPYGVARTQSDIGVVYEEMSEPQKAIEQYLKALKFFENDPEYQSNAAATLMNIGVIHKKQKNYSEAENYYRRAQVIIDSDNDEDMKLRIRANQGSMLIEAGKPDKAKSILKEAYVIAKKENHQQGIATVTQNLAILEYYKGNLSQAADYFTLAGDAHESYGNLQAAMTTRVGIAEIYIKNKEAQKAIPLLKNAIAFYEETNDSDRLFPSYLSLSSAFAYNREPDSARAYIDKYVELREKYDEENNKEIIFELDKKYQTEKKDRELAEQKSAILQKELEAKQRNLYLILLGLGLFFAVIIGWLIIRQKTLKNNQLRQESKLKAAQAEIEKQNSLQEQRLSISRDLHDNIGSQLTFLISSMDSLRYAKQVAPETANDKLENLSQFTRKTIGELRDTIWAMNHDEISFQDLQERLTSHINTANQASATTQILLNIDPEINKAHSFDSVKGMHIFRLIQEAINNSIKYSGSDTIHIDFEKADLNGKNAFKVTIKDDGKGFDPEQVASGNGMRYMKERADAIEADFNLTSSPENGTSVIAVVPC